MKEQITQLSKAIEALGDNATQEQKDALKSLEQLSQTASTNESKIEDLQAQLAQKESDLSLALRDTMKYKDIQRKAQEHMTETDKQLDELKQKYANYDELQEQVTNLKQLEVERDNSIRTKYHERIEQIKDKPYFENVKEYLTLPTEEQKLEELPIDQINSSLKELDKFEKLSGVQSVGGGKETQDMQVEHAPTFLEKVFGKLD